MGKYKHGHARRGQHTKTYFIWLSMLNRCRYASQDSYKYYGARGIKVCTRWEKYENFLADMGEWKPGLTLERIDFNKDYSKENCRWTTFKEQARNTRKNKFIMYKGKTQCISAWVEELHLNYARTYARLYILNWPVKRAFSP